MTIDIKKMRQKLADLHNRGNGSTRFWKPQDGENVIRILPTPDGAPFKHFHFHYKMGESKGGFLCPKKQFGEDFVFDAHEAVTNPGSDSAKALKQMIDREADQKVKTRLDSERRKMQATQMNLKQGQVEDDFKRRQNMSNEDFETMRNWANSREMTIDDIYYLMTREKSNENATQAGKQDMLNQMKAVRNIPTSMSGTNSPTEDKDPNDTAWDIIKGSDDSADNLFG